MRASYSSNSNKKVGCKRDPASRTHDCHFISDCPALLASQPGSIPFVMGLFPSYLPRMTGPGRGPSPPTHSRSSREENPVVKAGKRAAL